jgi:hypothetical protein
MGLNPYFHDEDTVFNAIQSNSDLFHFSEKITELYFYGAGCSAPHLNSIIERGLQRAFPNAEVHVGHDLTACAYATYTGIPAISCIIGTGSNSCYFDGNVVSEVIPALGYILGTVTGIPTFRSFGFAFSVFANSFMILELILNISDIYRVFLFGQ